MFSWDRPKAGTVCYPRLVAPQRLDLSGVEAFTEDLVQSAGVLLLPASVYSHATSVARGHFRLGFGRADLPVCLAKLEAYLDQKLQR